MQDQREPQLPPHVDERYLSDWIRYGLLELALYLERHAQFDAWCESRERPHGRSLQ